MTSSITESDFFIRPDDPPMFAFKDDGSAVVTMAGYFAFPKEVLSEKDRADIWDRAQKMFPRKIDVEALNAQRANDAESERLRALGVAFRDDLATED